MKLYKFEDRFSPKTGKKIDPAKVFVSHVCDFTGVELGKYDDENISYEINYNSIDPNFGDGIYEDELCKYLDEVLNVDDLSEVLNELLSQEYVFNEGFSNTFSVLIHSFIAEHPNTFIPHLDHLLRWSRCRTILMLLKNGNYELENFLE
jgi:hypothetical protein